MASTNTSVGKELTSSAKKTSIIDVLLHYVNVILNFVNYDVKKKSLKTLNQWLKKEQKNDQDVASNGACAKKTRMKKMDNHGLLVENNNILKTQEEETSDGEDTTDKSLFAKETEELKDKFRLLFSWTMDTVASVTVETVLSWLPDKITSDFKDVKSVDDIFTLIIPRVTWYNFKLLECIIDKVDDNNLQLEYDSYKQFFNDYARHRVSLLTLEVLDNNASLEHVNLPFLRIKIDKEWNKTAISDIHKVLSEFVAIFDLHEALFFLISVKEGCIELEYSIPQKLLSSLRRVIISDSQRRELISLDILSIQLENYMFFSRSNPVETKLYPKYIPLTSFSSLLQNKC